MPWMIGEPRGGASGGARHRLGEALASLLTVAALSFGFVLLLIAILVAGVVIAFRPNDAPLRDLEALPEARVKPMPGATLIGTISEPRRFSIEGTEAARLARTFGTDADPYAVESYYASVLESLGWQGSYRSWSKPGYVFSVDIEEAREDPANPDNFFVVYREQLFEDLSADVRATPRTRSSAPPPSPLSGEASPVSLEGLPVFYGAAIEEEARRHPDGSTFLIGGWLRLEQELCFGDWCRYGWYLVADRWPVLPPYARLVQPDPAADHPVIWGVLDGSDGRAVLRVHPDPSPRPCPPAGLYCPPTLRVDEVVWEPAPAE